MKKVFYTLLSLTFLSCTPKYPSFRDLDNQNQYLDFSEVVINAVQEDTFCFETSMGLDVFREVNSSCPSYKKVDRITREFCWEFHTPSLRARPQACLQGFNIITSEQLTSCNILRKDLTPERCISGPTAVISWTRKSLIAGPNQVGLGWGYHLWHTACHFRNPGDFGHKAPCYNRSFATDKLKSIDEDHYFPY